MENLVRNRCIGVTGPSTILLGLSCLLGCNVRLRFVLNKLGIAPPYDTVDRLRKRLIMEDLEDSKWTLTYLQNYPLAVFAIDNVDTTNQHVLVVHGKSR